MDLSTLGMKSGQQYETIITTENTKAKLNAAPIGVICTGEKTILCRIFKGSTTLKNIISQKEFIVNITSNPTIFTYSTINNLPENYFNKKSLNDADAYFKCKVTDLKEGITRSDPIRKSEATIIKAEVCKIIINKPCPKAMNRGIHLLIESLVNYSKIDLVDKQQQNYLLGRFKEAKRIINKVGSKEDKKAINILKESLKNKGFNL